MDETQIASQLAQNITTETHIPAPVTQDEPVQSAFDSNVEITDPAVAIQFADYFDVPNMDRYNEHTQRQLREIYRWAAERAQSTDMDKILPIVRMLENELGATFTADKLQRLAKFVKLQKQSDVLRHQMGALYA